MYQPSYLFCASFDFFPDFYFFGPYRSLLRIVLRSCVILVLMGLAYVFQNNKQIYFSLPLVSFLALFSVSLFSFFLLSALKLPWDLRGYTTDKKVCPSWWWNSKPNGNSRGERVVLGEAPLLLKATATSARNPIAPRSRIETSIVIVATAEIDIARVAGDKAVTAGSIWY